MAALLQNTLQVLKVAAARTLRTSAGGTTHLESACASHRRAAASLLHQSELQAAPTVD